MKALQKIQAEIAKTHEEIDKYLQIFDESVGMTDDGFEIIREHVRRLRLYARGLYFAEKALLE